jgi:hypothetical protein
MTLFEYNKLCMFLNQQNVWKISKYLKPPKYSKTNNEIGVLCKNEIIMQCKQQSILSSL